MPPWIQSPFHMIFSGFDHNRIASDSFVYMNETCHWFHLWPAGCTNPTDLGVLRDLCQGKHPSEIPVLTDELVWLGAKWLFKATTHWGRVHIIDLLSAVSQSLLCSEIIVADQTRPEESDIYSKPKSAYSCLTTMPFQRVRLWVDTICPTWQRALFDTFAFLFGFERGSHCVAHFPTSGNYPAPTFQVLADTPGFVFATF